jgi:hypothetical protein
MRACRAGDAASKSVQRKAAETKAAKIGRAKLPTDDRRALVICDATFPPPATLRKIFRGRCRESRTNSSLAQKQPPYLAMQLA